MRIVNILRKSLIMSEGKLHEATPDEPRLKKAARVGAVLFQKGVPERLVIECAQRAQEYKEAEERGENPLTDGRYG